MDILDIEASEVKGVGHLSLAIRPLVSQDSCPYGCLCGAIGVGLEVGKLPREALGEGIAEGLLTVVRIACFGQCLSTLIAVEEVGGTIPQLPLGIYIEGEVLLALADRERTPCGCRCGDTGKADACCREYLLEKLWVRGLDDNSWVLGEEELDKVGLWDSVEIDLESTLLVGKAHLQQCGDKSTSRDIVSSDKGSTLQELLHRSEGLAEVFGLPDVGCLVSHLSEYLGKGRPAEGEWSKAKVNMVERIARVGDEDGREYLLHV